jgi:hypothetical protein
MLRECFPVTGAAVGKHVTNIVMKVISEGNNRKDDAIKVPKNRRPKPKKKASNSNEVEVNKENDTRA